MVLVDMVSRSITFGWPRIPDRDRDQSAFVRLLMVQRTSLGADTNHACKDQAFDSAATDLTAPSVILVRTFLDKNVGTVARAMLN
jgi:hypothetical protein